MSALVLAGAVLAVPDDTDKAAPLGLLVVVILGVACYFLFRSMSRHLRKVREDFPAEPYSRSKPTAAATAVPPEGPASAEPEPAEPPAAESTSE